jgi:hypothetical protein
VRLAAAKKKNSYLQAQFHRIKARRGPKRPIMAVAASILSAINHMLKVQIPAHRGQSFRRIADSVPVIADSF